jgi:anti-sigma regulatory factor (Ser/Thr protein kinase)
MTPIPSSLSLTIKNDFAAIAPLSEAVDKLCRRHGVPPEMLYAVKLALDEMLTNVISYGYEDQSEHLIAVRCAIADGEIVAEIEDDARPFNPLEAPSPQVETPLEEKPIGGLGIHLAKTMMDRLDYRRENGKNILIMRKRFS